MSFCVFTYYTKNTPYDQEAKKLQKSCKKFNVPFVKVSVNSQGSWVENTMIKPKIILKALQNTKYDCLVWIDADGRLKGYPDLFEKFDKNGIDLGLFQMGSQSRITSGTIFLRNNNKIKTFVQDWEELCNTTSERLGDQHCLRILIKNNGYKPYKIRYKPLPYSYCYIFDDSLRSLAPKIPKLKGDPVIFHTQASRKYKGKKL